MPEERNEGRERRDRKEGGFRKGPRDRRDFRNKNIPKLIEEVESKLLESIKPESIVGLNSFERKLVHRHFDHSEEFQTRTYRDGEKYTLKVYPVANIERLARDKADESMRSGEEVALPAMGSYERYLVHTSLKDVAGIETVSRGEGSERHVSIVSKKFGRGLKKIAKKIKLF